MEHWSYTYDDVCENVYRNCLLSYFVFLSPEIDQEKNVLNAGHEFRKMAGIESRFEKKVILRISRKKVN